MSRIFAAAGEGVDSLPVEDALACAEAAAFDHVVVHREPGLVLGVAARFTEPEDALGPHLRVSDTSILAWDGRLDAREALAASLDVGVQVSNAELAFRALVRWGVKALDRLVGDFAFVFVDRTSKNVLAARDHFGVRPLFHAKQRGCVAFASTERLLLELLDLSSEPDADAIGRALADAYVTEGETLYRHVASVRHGHSLRVDGGQSSSRRYFEPERFTVDATSHDDEHAGRLLAALEAAVADRVRGRPPHGADASGGLDSSSVVALASTHLRERALPPPVLLHMLGEGPSDESRWARAIAERYGAELLVRDGGAPFEPVAVDGIDLPDVWCATSAAFYDDLARRGARVALTGEGSDEVQTRGGLEVEDALAGLRLMEAARGAGLYDEPFSRRAWYVMARGVGRLLAPEVWARRALRSHLHALPAWLSPRGRSVAGAGVARVAELYASLPGSPMRRRVAGDLLFSSAFTWILPVAQRFASHRGIDLTHPFLDMRVVSVFLQLPARLRGADGRTKALHRRVMAPRLPPGVAWRWPPADYSRLFEQAFVASEHGWQAIARNHRLADLGLVDPVQFQRALKEGFARGWLGFSLRTALRFELWLAVNASRGADNLW